MFKKKFTGFITFCKLKEKSIETKKWNMEKYKNIIQIDFAEESKPSTFC